MIRIPAVAGVFYPDEQNTLSSQIDHFLEDSHSKSPIAKAYILPHAGYIYSGPIAASGYKALADNDTSFIKKVVLIGPSHRVPFKGIATPESEAFSTPLGGIPLDLSMLGKLIDQFDFVFPNEMAHAHEHSLEVHLPFLQQTIGDFELIPLLVGDSSAEDVSRALLQTWGGDETLIVCSSDLSHYLPYDCAVAADHKTSQLIETKHYEELDGQRACGYKPVQGLLKIAQQKSLDVEILDVRNSGDTAGPEEEVVGYGAYAIR